MPSPPSALPLPPSALLPPSDAVRHTLTSSFNQLGDSASASEQQGMVLLLQAGQRLLLAALEHIRAAPALNTVASRVGVLYNPTDPAKEPSLLAKILQVVLDLPSRRSKIPGKCGMGLEPVTCACWWDAQSARHDCMVHTYYIILILAEHPSMIQASGRWFLCINGNVTV